MAEELRVVGKSIPRSDACEKATGAARFTGDMWLYGMLHGKVLRSPYAHARIVSIDTSKAERLQGVKAILTYKDVPRALIGESGLEDAYVLPDKVRFAGEEVLAVAAESEEIAEQALELIDVKYEELPVVLTPEEALKPEAPLIPPPEVSATNLSQAASRTLVLERGDVEQGFGQADLIVEDNYHTSFVQHLPIEPRACLAKWDDEKLSVWVSTQQPFAYRRTIAGVLGIPQTRVKVISPYVGGSFGSKYEGRYAILAAIMARKTGRPVLFRFTREEDMLSKMRQAADIQVRIGVKKDGTFSAIFAKLTTASGGYIWSHNTAAATAILALFRTPHARFEALGVYTNHPYTGELRGVANAIMTFGLAQSIDRTAEELGLDPVEFIKRTHIQAGDECKTTREREGTVLSSCGLDECLERGAEAIGWQEKWRGYRAPVEVRGHKRIGMGMAALTHPSSITTAASGSVVKINSDGTFDLLIPVVEMGTGNKTTQAQVLAEASGIPFETIHVINADTEVTPLCPYGQIASTSAHTEALATKLAGEDARRQLLEQAAIKLDVKPEALEIEDGVIYVKGNPDRATSIREIAAMVGAGLTPVVGRGVVTCPNWPAKARSFGAVFAEVEVDTETGEVRVLKYVAVHDVGRAINPAIVQGQIIGGVVMGISWALSEELRFDNQGRPLNFSLTDYKIFTSADCPQIIPIIVESDDPLGPYGAKGFGEAPIVAVPGCIANAIHNAIGIRFKELPITPEKIVEALSKGKREYP
jgi:CO/xanthine dehydrogenase Mo-binding subunit